MKSYQKANDPIKGSIQIHNEEVRLETAGEGLLNLTVELGMATLRQILEADVTELVGEKRKTQQSEGHILARKEAHKSFRRVKGYRQIPLLVSAIEINLKPSCSTLIAKSA